MAEHRALVPDDFEPPTNFAVGAFRLEPLGPEHNELSEADHEETFRRGVAGWLVSDAWPFRCPLYEPFLDEKCGA